MTLKGPPIAVSYGWEVLAEDWMVQLEAFTELLVRGYHLESHL
jgi:hypothetical protein